MCIINVTRFSWLLPPLAWSMKARKDSLLAPPRGIFYKIQSAWQGVKLTWLMSIFTSKKVWKFLIQIQLTKSNPKIYMGVKVPCLMPIRVKWKIQFLHSIQISNLRLSKGPHTFKCDISIIVGWVLEFHL